MDALAIPPELAAAADLLDESPGDAAWRSEARPEQLPPEGDWFVWLIVAGRGWGETRSGAETLASWALATPGDWAVVARSTQDLRETCLEGSSGLLQALGLRFDSPEYNRQTGLIRLPNGSRIYNYSAESPERLRGPNLSGAWCDEFATWRYESMWTEGLMPALRIGNPRIVVTTTPRPIPLLRQLLTRDDGSVVVTRGSTFDNAANLSPQALAELQRRYDGTRIGRPELLGEMIDDVEGALWSRALIDPHRVKRVDPGSLVRIVVAIDPAVTSGEKADDTGIVVAGIDAQGDAYVLDDLTLSASPDTWARQAVHALEKWGADRVVAEANNGGALVETVLRTVDRTLPYTAVHASRGKLTRAEPCAAYTSKVASTTSGNSPSLRIRCVPGCRGSATRLIVLTLSCGL